MNDKEDKELERIGKFIRKELNTSELKEFELSLIENPELQKKVSLMETTVSGLKYAGFKNRMQSIEDDVIQSNNIRRIILWVSSSAAAIILVIISVFLLSNESSSGEIFTNYFEPYPDRISVRGNTGGPWTRGLKKYSERNYKEAIMLLSASDNPSELRLEIAFYLALSHLAMNESGKAIEILSELRKNDIKYNQQITWYLGLAYLKKGDLLKAKNVLSHIKKSEYEHENAQKILLSIEDLIKE